MTILDTIIEHKKEEVATRRRATPAAQLQQEPLFHRGCFSASAFLMDECRTGIIAEFKRRSPSKGIINDQAAVTDVTRAYADHGASCISVLTDTHFFGGSTQDLLDARFNDVPLLRKDFMIDPYQVTEAKAMGADLILLIAACLSKAQVLDLSAQAVSLGMEVLLELHADEELGHICSDTRLVGINNRDLKTFIVDIDRSLAMAGQLPPETIKIAESGISSVEMVRRFRKNGFRGFLMGENFMKESDPGLAFAKFAGEMKVTRLPG